MCVASDQDALEFLVSDIKDDNEPVTPEDVEFWQWNLSHTDFKFQLPAMLESLLNVEAFLEDLGKHGAQKLELLRGVRVILQERFKEELADDPDVTD